MKTTFDELNRLVSDWLYKNNLMTFQSKLSPPDSLFFDITKVCPESVVPVFLIFTKYLRCCASGSATTFTTFSYNIEHVKKPS